MERANDRQLVERLPRRAGRWMTSARRRRSLTLDAIAPSLLTYPPRALVQPSHPPWPLVSQHLRPLMSLSLPSAGRPQENATASTSSAPAVSTPAFNPALNLPLSAPTPAPMGAPTPAPTPGGSGQLLSVPE